MFVAKDIVMTPIDICVEVPVPVGVLGDVTVIVTFRSEVRPALSVTFSVAV